MSWPQTEAQLRMCKTILLNASPIMRGHVTYQLSRLKPEIRGRCLSENNFKRFMRKMSDALKTKVTFHAGGFSSKGGKGLSKPQKRMLMSRFLARLVSPKDIKWLRATW